MLVRIPGVLDAEALRKVGELLRGAAFVSGDLSASAGARGVKRNLQLPPDSGALREVTPIVLNALRRSATFFSAALPARIMNPMINRYDTGMSYGDHFDSGVSLGATPVRADIAVTLFLSAPADYDGGELVIDDSFGSHRVKLEAGSAIVYPASSRHRVETVTRGSRLAAVLWVQSMVRDEAKRRILFDLDLAIGAIARDRPGADELSALTGTYHNLLRLWAEA